MNRYSMRPAVPFIIHGGDLIERIVEPHEVAAVTILSNETARVAFVDGSQIVFTGSNDRIYAICKTRSL